MSAQDRLIEENGAIKVEYVRFGGWSWWCAAGACEGRPAEIEVRDKDRLHSVSWIRFDEGISGFASIPKIARELITGLKPFSLMTVAEDQGTSWENGVQYEPA